MEKIYKSSRELYVKKLHKAVSGIGKLEPQGFFINVLDGMMAFAEPEFPPKRKTSAFSKKMQQRLALLSSSGQMEDAKNLAADFYRSVKRNLPELEANRAS